MTTLADVAHSIEQALKTVAGVRFHALGENVDPPGVVLGPPRLTWDGYADTPTSATFSVFLVVAADELALERLWRYVMPVSTALDAVDNACVRSADPGLYAAGTADLPCYTFTVDVSLT